MFYSKIRPTFTGKTELGDLIIPSYLELLSMYKNYSSILFYQIATSELSIECMALSVIIAALLNNVYQLEPAEPSISVDLTYGMKE